jgi:hypothetical protein
MRASAVIALGGALLLGGISRLRSPGFDSNQTVTYQL